MENFIHTFQVSPDICDGLIDYHNNNMESINMTNKDDLVLYESATIFHGRPIPFRGDSFVNLFIHFKTNDWIEVEEKIRDKFKMVKL